MGHRGCRQVPQTQGLDISRLAFRAYVGEALAGPAEDVERVFMVFHLDTEDLERWYQQLRRHPDIPPRMHLLDRAHPDAVRL